MLSTADKDFLAMCMLVKQGEYPKEQEAREYFSHGGFINFYNGNYQYAIRDCDATRKYLEHRGYSEGTSEKWVQGFNLQHMDDYLTREGPSSYNYRKLMSYLIVPVRDKTWDKLDRLQSFDEIYKGIAWLFQNDIYLGPFKGEDFLRTPEGKDTILRYARLNGMDFYGRVEEILMKKGLYNPATDGLNTDKYLEGLKTIPYESFEEILKEVEQQMNNKPHSRT